MTATLTRPPAAEPAAPAAANRAALRLDIQGMRAIAVLLVVLYHAGVPGLTGGYVGVDIFFVISGFLITGQIVREFERTGRLDLVGFYARRMRRLLPAALLVIVATVVVARVAGPLLQIKSTALDGLYSSLYVINYHLAAEGVDYQQANAAPSPLQHMWSLAVEEQFYLVWPVIAIVTTFLVRRYRPALLRPVLAVVIVCGLVVSLYVSHVVTAQSAPTAYFSVQTRAWEFAFGALVAVTAPALARLPRVWAVGLSWVGLIAIAYSAFAYDDATPFPGTAALVPVVGAAAMIVAGTRSPAGVDTRAAAATLTSRPVQRIGTWSYSWYLWHWPILVLAPAVIGHSLSWWRNLELMALALWIAALTYAIVERSTQRGRLQKRRWLVRGLALSGVGVLAATLVIHQAPRVQGNGRYAAALDLSSPGAELLSKALVASSSTRTVPGNLSPTLDKAADDVPVTQSGCHLDFLQVKQGLCAYADRNATHTVVVFGDSHAQQWDGAFIAAAKAKHWRVISWTKAACPVADLTIVNPELKRTYTECDTWRAATLKRIAALEPDLVVASQSDSVPGHGVANQTWADDTAATLKPLQDAGVNVVFLADTPYPRSDVPTCVAAHLDDIQQCEVSRANAYHSANFYADRHQRMVTTLRSADIKVVDPIDWLCASMCPVIVQNTLVYRDDSHMSNTYSTALGPIVEPLLTAGARK